MRKNLNAILIAVVISTTLTACAQTKGGTKNSTSSKKGATAKASDKAILLEATSQTTLPGRPESSPTTKTRFVIVWKNNNTPKSIFWRGESGWIPCQMNMVKNYTPYNEGEADAHSRNYQTERLGSAVVSKNDTLELVPTAGGKFPIPDGVPSDATNTIFYNTTASDTWQALKVDNIVRRQDIVMP